MLGITMGDANGVGPEILLKTYMASRLPERSVVIGDYAILARCNELLDLGAPLQPIAEPPAHQAGGLNICDMGLLGQDDLAIGEVSRLTGAAARAYIEQAARFVLNGAISAMVTLPVNKQAIRLSDETFTGHTELIARLCKTVDYTMMLASAKLIVTHVSTHVSLREAIERVTRERICTVIRLTAGAVRKLRPQVRIAIAALNPHAGEDGAFGVEDAEQIEPAVAEARGEGLDVVGPVPADTVFHRATQGEYDAVVCMYHDQGHVAAKLVDFDGAVNVTLGLPIVRTSVDHGTAFDIAYTGQASTRSFANACSLALQLAGNREEQDQ